MAGRAAGVKRAAPAAGLLFIVLWLFRRAVFQGEVFYEKDIHTIWVSLAEAFVRAVAGGSWPTWDPLPAFGQPYLANPFTQALYPFTWLNLLMPPWTCYTVFVVIHAWLSGVAMYALARRWELTPAAAFAAAAVWITSGPFQSFVALWHHFAGACWIPAVFLSAQRALERGGVWVLVWGGAAALQVLAGSTEVVAMTALALGLYMALCHLRWRKGQGTYNGRALVRTAAAAVLAVSLTAALWVPAADLVSRAGRRELPHDVRTYWSLSGWALLDLVFPGTWGPFVHSRPEHLRELREPLLGSLYLGVPSLALAGAAVGACLRRRTVFLAVLGTGATLVALGRHAPFYDLAVALVPPLGLFRFPAKAMIVAGFVWALLAGTGLDALRGGLGLRRRAAWLPVLAPLLLVAAVAWGGLAAARLRPEWLKPAPWVLAPSALPASDVLPATQLRLRVCGTLATLSLGLALLLRARPARWPGTALAVLAVGDLMAYHDYASLAPEALYTHRPQALAALYGTAAPRVYVYDYQTPGPSAAGVDPYTLARAPAGWDAGPAYALGMQVALAWQAVERWGVRGAYEPDLVGLQPRTLAALSDVLKRVEGRPVHGRLLRMGSVTHVIALHALPGRDLVPVAEIPGLFERPVRVWRVVDPLPRAYLAPAARVLDGGAALARLLQPDWNPAVEVVLAAGEGRDAPAGFAGSAGVRAEASDRLTIETDSSHPAHLVVTDTYDPGWSALIDGRPAPVLRANTVFRAVPVPAGRHQVVLRYVPPGLAAGAAVSVAAALLGTGLVLVAFRRRAARGSAAGAP